MKKTREQLEHKRLIKIRAAIRGVWQYDFDRKRVIDEARIGVSTSKDRAFICPVCDKPWPIELATVDHEPELGKLPKLEEFGDWIVRCFTGPMRAICKPCHKKKPKAKRRTK